MPAHTTMLSRPFCTPSQGSTARLPPGKTSLFPGPLIPSLSCAPTHIVCLSMALSTGSMSYVHMPNYVHGCLWIAGSCVGFISFLILLSDTFYFSHNYLSCNYLYKWEKKLLMFKNNYGYFVSVTPTILWDHQGQKPGLFCFIVKA